MLRNNLSFRFKYKSRTLLNALIEKCGGNGIYNLKGPKVQKDKHALVIYSVEAVSKYLSQTLSEFSALHSHSGFRETIELLDLLLDLGYTVDYFDFKAPPPIDWNKYELVIDSGNSLEYSKAVTGQKKIFYATTCHWRLFYENAYRHSDSFYRRHQLLLYPDRELKTNYSDDAADLITCFGGSYQAKSFGPNSHKVRHLNISTTFVPPAGFKKRIASRKKFMWYAGYGVFHKGLDLVVEAFAQMPDMELHIFGHIEANPRLYNWFLSVAKDAGNIRYHGWASPDSASFQEYVQLCDAVVFAGSSEGGAGAIIQCLQFGLIPIINRSTAIDLANDRFNIDGSSPEEEIQSIIHRVQQFAATAADDLQQQADALAQTYSAKHTLGNYRESLQTVIQEA